MNVFKMISVFLLSIMLIDPGFAQRAPRPERPGPSRDPQPRPPRPPREPRPQPRPEPAPRPRPMPVPDTRPAPRPHPRPIPRPIPRPRPYPAPRPRPNPYPVPSNVRACFYEYENFQGRYFCVNPGGMVMNLSSIMFNNRISSAIIPPGFYATVYQYESYQGESLTLTGHISDLSMYGYYWNDNISAIDYRY